MNSCPPRKQNTGQGQSCQDIGTCASDVPDPLLTKRSSGPVRQHDRASEDERAIGPDIPSRKAFLGTLGPERGEHPGNGPCEPD